ncbi:MAG: SDR family NAD(P)-dependent oxidoreductase [Nitrososphaeraceae archaeon]
MNTSNQRNMQNKTAIITGNGRGIGKEIASFSDLSSYYASKFGLLGLAESLALEVDSYNMRVMTIFLGQVATRIWQDYDYNYYEKTRIKCLILRRWQQELLK